MILRGYIGSAASGSSKSNNRIPKLQSTEEGFINWFISHHQKNLVNLLHSALSSKEGLK